MFTKIETEKAPAAIGPYSQAMFNGNVLLASGQIPLDPATGEIVGSDIKEQTAQVLKNITAILEASRMTAENVVKTTCFLHDMVDFPAFNEIYGAYFTNKPARSCVAVKQLPKNALCEIEIIAYK